MFLCCLTLTGCCGRGGGSCQSLATGPINPLGARGSTARKAYHEASQCSCHFLGRDELQNRSQPRSAETLHHAGCDNALQKPSLHIQMRHVFNTQYCFVHKVQHELFSVFRSPDNHWTRLVSTQPHYHQQQYLYINLPAVLCSQICQVGNCCSHWRETGLLSMTCICIAIILQTASVKVFQHKDEEEKNK